MIAENIAVSVEIRIIHFAFSQIGFFDFIGGAVSFFHTSAIDHIFHFAAVESCTFAGFAEIEVCNYPRLTVNLNFETFS
jgi:hypothetical protein